MKKFFLLRISENKFAKIVSWTFIFDFFFLELCNRSEVDEENF